MISGRYCISRNLQLSLQLLARLPHWVAQLGQPLEVELLVVCMLVVDVTMTLRCNNWYRSLLLHLILDKHGQCSDPENKFVIMNKILFYLFKGHLYGIFVIIL